MLTPMPPRVRAFYSGLCIALFAISAALLAQELMRRRDIWWTPHAMMVPLSGSTDRVEIYLRNRPLAAVVQAGDLRVANNPQPVALAEVGLRFNNWDQVRAHRLPMLLVLAAGCGLSVALLVLTVTGRIAYRGDAPPA